MSIRRPINSSSRRIATVTIVGIVVAIIILPGKLPTFPTINPLVGQLAPGAAPAITRALGPGGLID